VTPTASDPADLVGATTTYQWQVSDGQGNWSNITNATNATFTPDETLDGKTIRVQAIMTDGEGLVVSAPAYSTPVTVSEDTSEVSTISITGFSGSATENQQLTVSTQVTDTDATAGTEPAGTISYQWQVNLGTDQNPNWQNLGTNSAAYTPSETDEGHALRVTPTPTPKAMFRSPRRRPAPCWMRRRRCRRRSLPAWRRKARC
jgi:hypothetical protein